MVAGLPHVGWFRVAIGALGVGLAAIAAPTAAADPAAPADPSVLVAPAMSSADPGPAPVADAALSEPASATVPAGAPVAAPPDVVAAATPPEGVQHLPSPDSLPPGTTQQAPERPTAGLLRDIWHAVRDGEMTGPDALKLLAATRPVDPEKLAASTPSNGPIADAPPAPDGPPDPATAPVIVPSP